MVTAWEFHYAGCRSLECCDCDGTIVEIDHRDGKWTISWNDGLGYYEFRELSDAVKFAESLPCLECDIRGYENEAPD